MQLELLSKRTLVTMRPRLDTGFVGAPGHWDHRHGNGQPTMDETPHSQPARPGRRRSTGRVIVALLLIATFVLGATAGRFIPFGSNAGASGSNLADQPGYGTLEETWQLIHEQYVDIQGIDDQDLIYGAARGMVDALGDTGHSAFMDPEETKSFNAAQSGELIGIGVMLDYQDGWPIVIAPISDSPAEAAGIQAGDLIVAVDDVATQDMTWPELSGRIRGEEGTDVKISVERPSTSEKLDFVITRARIELDPVAWTMLPDNIALVRLNEFSAGSSDQLKDALVAARDAGATSLILDLRNNPGGLVSEVIAVGSQFMPEGTVLFQQREQGTEPTSVLTVGNDGAWLDLPMRVLINRGSASAAEILSSSLAENGRAVTIGEKTFGTGTVLTPFTLSDGSTALLGTSEWLTAEGHVIWKEGVEPIIALDLVSNAEIISFDDEQPTDQAALDEAKDEPLNRAIQDLTGRGTPVPVGSPVALAA